MTEPYGKAYADGRECTDATTCTSVDSVGVVAPVEGPTSPGPDDAAPSLEPEDRAPSAEAAPRFTEVQVDGVDVSDPAAVAQALAVDDSLLLRVTFAAVVDPATLVAGSTDQTELIAQLTYEFTSALGLDVGEVWVTNIAQVNGADGRRRTQATVLVQFDVVIMSEDIALVIQTILAQFGDSTSALRNGPAAEAIDSNTPPVFAFVIQEPLPSGPDSPCKADTNKDGLVDVKDLIEVLIAVTTSVAQLLET